MTICAICSTAINPNGDPLHLSCSGVCGRLFHAHCAGVSESTLSELLADCGLCWLCKQCDALRKSKKPVLFPEIEAALVNSMDGIFSSLGNAINSIRADLLHRLKQDLFSESASFDSAYGKRDAWCPLRTSLPLDLPSRHLPPAPWPAVPPAPAMQQGTGSGSTYDPVFVAPRPQSLHVINVTDKHVITMVTNRLAFAPSDVVVRRLVKLGANVETMSFVSFKVGVPSSKREDYLTPATWPPSLVFREFIDYQNRHLPVVSVNDTLTDESAKNIDSARNTNTVKSIVARLDAPVNDPSNFGSLSTPRLASMPSQSASLPSALSHPLSDTCSEPTSVLPALQSTSSIPSSSSSVFIPARTTGSSRKPSDRSPPDNLPAPVNRTPGDHARQPSLSNEPNE